jgi:hypothetical protein
MQLPGLRTDQGNLMPDGDVFLIGETSWEWVSEDGTTEDESLTIAPVGAVPRDIAAILTAPSPTATVMPAGLHRQRST